jgi:MoxR-like ATPase
VVDAAEIADLQRLTHQVFVHPAMETYIVRLVAATRVHEAIQLGASPRGSLALYRTSQALAAIRGRDYVLPDDVQQMLGPALEHRLMVTSRTRVRGRDASAILQEIQASVAVPVEESWSVETSEL